jgi:hypothetical protein
VEVGGVVDCKGGGHGGQADVCFASHGWEMLACRLLGGVLLVVSLASRGELKGVDEAQRKGGISFPNIRPCSVC